tara:strand:- start:769 stop:1107 length:339 start_codon:yes stop_codon:yes gene_type:complete
MDIMFDKIPATAVSNELYAMKLFTKKARRLWISWSKDNPASGFFEKYNALVGFNYSNFFLYYNRLYDLDFIVDTFVLKTLANNENNLKVFNPILEFVMVAREAGLKTNRIGG